MTYNMEEFFDSCLDRYTELAGPTFKYKKVPTPFLEDLVKKGPCAPDGNGEWLECSWCKARLALESFLHGKGRNYTGCAGTCSTGPPGSNSSGGATAGGAGAATSESPGSTSSGGATTEPGVLSDIAAKVLMKVLYGARMARFDLLRAVCSLACSVTKWDKDCDRKLHRLMC